jgi:hypothetical protein
MTCPGDAPMTDNERLHGTKPTTSPVHDIPDVWADLHGLLLAAVERAIAELGQPHPPGPEPAREPL